MIILGTAGHIDHGKSSIVKRLTGTDPDRLPEEKARGLTIDLGFAFYRTESGIDIGLVDVPGHERFVRNMIAGAGGIDAVMLVIAADDGWMPQSEEHFQITRLLGVTHGLIVINKIDLVKSDWLALLEDEIKSKTKGTYLQNAPIIKLSAVTGEGFERLKNAVAELADTVGQRAETGIARLAIDRSFIRPGMGGVVTGTLRGDKLKVGQTVGLWPSRLNARIRTLQSNNQEVDEATPGQRTAVSFTGVDRKYLVRGGVVTSQSDFEYFTGNPVLALGAELLANSPFEIADRRRLLLIAGTTEVEGEVRIFDRDSLQPGASGLLFFRPDAPVYALVGDRTILRLPTPMVTVGGAIILDHLPAFPRRRNLDSYEYLHTRLDASKSSLVESELQKNIIQKENTILEQADFPSGHIDEALKTLIEIGVAGQSGHWIYHTGSMERVTKTLTEKMSAYFEKNAHVKGLPIGELSQLTGFSQRLTSDLATYLVEAKLLTQQGELYGLPGRGVALKGMIKEAYDQIMAQLHENEFMPPSLPELASHGKIHQQAIKYILDSGEGYKCGSAFVFLPQSWKQIVSFVHDAIDTNGKLEVTRLRDRFSFTRKYAIPILEELDRLGITERQGDIRVKGPKFES